jgi:hypothetical protein
VAVLLLVLAASARAEEGGERQRHGAVPGRPPARRRLPPCPIHARGELAAARPLFRQCWKGLNSRQLARIQDWSKENLATRQPTTFYMFSGPDFLYANAFFPGSTTYVLSGLEPVGRLPELKYISRRTLPGVLGHLRASTGSVLRITFFLTNQMRAQLHYAQLNGTLPILYTFLARSGKTITDVAFITLKPDGTSEPSDGVPIKGVPNGVKIGFTSGDGKPQTLYYFSTDVSNGGIKNSGFLKFCEQLGNGDAFVKSASYLMHNDSFSTVREFLLTHATSLVQDDTGVPIRFLKTDDWELRPSAAISGPSAYSAAVSAAARRTFSGEAAPSRSPSASATAGGPTSPICCWQPGRSAKPSAKRPSHRRPCPRWRTPMIEASFGLPGPVDDGRKPIAGQRG